MKNLSKIREDKKRYVAFLYFGGLFFLLMLVTAIVLNILFKDPTVSIVSETFDALFFEIFKAISGTAFGACLVGVIIDQYQERIAGNEKSLNDIIDAEGFVETFFSANDPSFLKYLHYYIEEAKSEINVIGLGLSVLALNLDLMEKIKDRMEKNKNLKVNIYIGSADNKGVLSRKKEEEEWHKSNSITYDYYWLERFPAEIRSFLRKDILESANKRLKIVDLTFCPWLTAIKIDDHYAIHIYGSPDIRGTRSFWLAFDDTKQKGKLVTFIDRIFNYCEEII